MQIYAIMQIRADNSVPGMKMTLPLDSGGQKTPHSSFQVILTRYANLCNFANKGNDSASGMKMNPSIRFGRSKNPPFQFSGNFDKVIKFMQRCKLGRRFGVGDENEPFH